MFKKTKKKILGVILARGGSKSIKKKNIYLLNNHPLISYSIAAAKNSEMIDKLTISSDSIEILNIAKSYGVDGLIKRPRKLANDKATSVDALHHAVKSSEKMYDTKFDYIIELPCVSPLRDHKDVRFALKKLTRSDYDSVISYVNTGEKHPIRLKRIKNKKIESFCKEYPEPSWGSRRQDFEPSYIRNGAIYAMTRECILKKNSRWGKKSYPMIMEDIKSVNIDSHYDLIVANMLIENGFCRNFPKKINKTEVFKNEKSNCKILITTPTHFLKEFKQNLKKNFSCIFAQDENVNKISKILKDIDYWICSPCPTYKINKNCLKNAKKLKAILTPSTGSTHLDHKYLKRKNIKLYSIKDQYELKNIKASSEFTFGLILDGLRKLSLSTLSSKNGFWRKQEDFLRGNQLYNKKLGIIGFGRIGSNVYKYSKAFGMKVYAYDPYKVKNLKKLKIYKKLNDLIISSDIILLSVHLNDQTKNLINYSYFKKMKKEAILVNSSRGEVLNEDDLIKALKSKKIKHAALDVIQKEQQSDIANHKLVKYSKKYKNLTITPHVAGLTYESEYIAANIIYKKLINIAK